LYTYQANFNSLISNICVSQREVWKFAKKA
jgi:hypothetical protein